ILHTLSLHDALPILYTIRGDVENPFYYAFLFCIPKDLRIGAVSCEQSDGAKHNRLTGAGLSCNHIKPGNGLHLKSAYECVIFYGKPLEHQGSTSLYASTMPSRGTFIFFFLIFETITWSSRTSSRITNTTVLLRSTRFTLSLVRVGSRFFTSSAPEILICFLLTSTGISPK